MSFADNRTDAQMKSIAQRQIENLHRKSAGKGRVDVTSKQLLVTMDSPELRIYSAQEGGFAIISKDDRVRPVLAYSDGVLDMDNMAPAMKWWLEKTTKAISYLSNSQGNMDLSKYAQRAVSVTPVEPLLKSYWDQQAPFNDSVPAIDGQLPPCGCVATAMAQVMYYHRWPLSASFTGSYTQGTPMVHKVEVNSTYKWEDMVEGYGQYFVNGQSKISTALKKNKRAVAPLTRDCGFAVNMEYTVNGSGAFSKNAATAFWKYFSYSDQSVRFCMRSFFADEEWRNLIYQDLQQGYPVMYGGVDSDKGGHAFVAHGVDAEGLLYINWGWSGSGSGYYDMDIMNAPGYRFSEGQDIICGIRKEPLESDYKWSVMATSEGLWQFKVSNSQRVVNVKPMSACYNLEALDFIGELDVVVEDAATRECNVVCAFDIDNPVPCLSGFSLESFSLDFDELKVENNKEYYIYFATRTADEKAKGYYSKIRCDEGKYYYKLSVNETGEISISSVMIETGLSQPHPKGETVLRGDANDDGTVTVTDIVATANHILGATPDVFNSEAADSNLDKEITVTDIVYDAQYILNGEFPEVTDPEDK